MLLCAFDGWQDNRIQLSAPDAEAMIAPMAANDVIPMEQRRLLPT